MRKQTIAITVVVLASIAKLQPIEPVVIVGRSMEPTFHNLQCVLATRNFDDVKRGDIVVFTKDGARMIKRVAYLPGDRVVESRNCMAWIRSDMNEELAAYRQHRPYRRVTIVPPGTIYVIGDNRADSEDSREFGPIPLKDVCSKLLYSDGGLGVPSDTRLAHYSAVGRKGADDWISQV